MKVCTVNRSVKGPTDSRGFTLVELLIVIVVLGLLATVVVFSVGGIADRGRRSSCVTDERPLVTAVEAYLGKYETPTIPSFGSGGVEEFEMTLVSTRLIHSVSSRWTVATDGTLSAQDPDC